MMLWVVRDYFALFWLLSRILGESVPAMIPVVSAPAILPTAAMAPTACIRCG